MKFTINTSDLDEAIVKVKILNDELEKAKSLINDMANPSNNQIEYALLQAEPLKPFACDLCTISDYDVCKAIKRAERKKKARRAWEK